MFSLKIQEQKETGIFLFSVFFKTLIPSIPNEINPTGDEPAYSIIKSVIIL